MQPYLQETTQQHYIAACDGNDGTGDIKWHGESRILAQTPQFVHSCTFMGDWTRWPPEVCSKPCDSVVLARWSVPVSQEEQILSVWNFYVTSCSTWISVTDTPPIHLPREVRKNTIQLNICSTTPRFSTYFSWIFRTRWTIGISLPSILKTTISPTLIGSSIRFVRNRRSPLWNAGSMLPLKKRRGATEQEEQLHSI